MIGSDTMKRILSALLLCVLLLSLSMQADALAVYASSTSRQAAAQSVYPVDVVGGENHTVVLYSDGTVAAIGDNRYGQCNVGFWKNIISLAAGFNYTVGVRMDGTVVATGDNSSGQCNVGSWRSIVQVSAGEKHTVGLRSDGTVVTAGDNSSHQCELEYWVGITQVAASKTNSIGLTADHQVAVRGTFTTMPDFRVGGWKNVSTVVSKTGYIAALKTDGTVVGTGRNTDPQGHGSYDDISVDGWRNVRQIALGRCNAFGVTWNGYVLCSGRNDYGQKDVIQFWNHIVSVGTGLNHVVGIREDGTLVAAGNNEYGQCNVQLLPCGTNSSWPLPGSSEKLLPEFPCVAKFGKLWTRGESAPGGYYHTPANAPNCWSDTSTPGHTLGAVRDNRGNVYTIGMHVDGPDSDSYSISYRIGGGYTTFSGVCGYPENVINKQWTPNYSKYFYVYGDGILLYTSPVMNANASPVPFEISVKGVNVLTITYPSSAGPNEAATLFDPILR